MEDRTEMNGLGEDILSSLFEKKIIFYDARKKNEDYTPLVFSRARTKKTGPVLVAYGMRPLDQYTGKSKRASLNYKLEMDVNGQKYHLMSFVVYKGSGGVNKNATTGGHWFTIARTGPKSNGDNTWMELNDSRVTLIRDQAQVFDYKEDVTMLFYLRDDEDQKICDGKNSPKMSQQLLDHVKSILLRKKEAKEPKEMDRKSNRKSKISDLDSDRDSEKSKDYNNTNYESHDYSPYKSNNKRKQPLFGDFYSDRDPEEFNGYNERYLIRDLYSGRDSGKFNDYHERYPVENSYSNRYSKKSNYNDTKRYELRDYSSSKSDERERSPECFFDFNKYSKNNQNDQGNNYKGKPLDCQNSDGSLNNDRNTGEDTLSGAIFGDGYINQGITDLSMPITRQNTSESNSLEHDLLRELGGYEKKEGW